MKKANSKERVKSAGKKPLAEDSTDLIQIYPEWSESEVSAEKWNTKHAFEDPETLLLPKSLRPLIDSWKRPSEITGDVAPVIVQPLNAIDDVFYSAGVLNSFGYVKVPTSNGVVSSPYHPTARLESLGVFKEFFEDEEEVIVQVNGQVKPDKDVREPSPPSSIGKSSNAGLDSTQGTSKLFHASRHVLSSELMRHLVSLLHFVYEQHKIAKASGSTTEEFCPWDIIYPKAKDGLPTYNASGKYIVKLNWLGAWRKITIDDRIPLDAQGRPLLLCSPLAHELWPLLISKAIIKLAQMSYKECQGMTEYGDFDILSALRGWVPECLALKSPVMSDRLRSLLMSINTVKPGPPPMMPLVNPVLSAAQQVSATLGKNASVTAPHMAALLKDTSLNPMRPSIAERQSSFTASNRPQSSLTGQVMIFATKLGDQSDPDLRNYSYPCRIVEIKESLLESETDLQDTYALKIRMYHSSGSKKSSAPLVKDKPDEPIDSSDFWIPASEFCVQFSSILIYHGPGSFKTFKSVSQILDPSKADVYRVPSVLSIGDDAIATSIIVMLSTFGRVNNSTFGTLPAVTIEEFSWKLQNFKEYQLRLSTNGCRAALFRTAPGHGYRFTIDCPGSYNLAIMSKEDFFFEEEGKYLIERNGLRIRDFEDAVPAQVGAAWVVLFKHQLVVNEPTWISAVVYMPDSLMSCTCVHVINNDNGVEIPEVFYNLPPTLVYPNKSGYTILADVKISGPRPAFRWKARIFGKNMGPPTEKEGVSTKLAIQDFEESFVPNKHNVLFRYTVKVKDTPINNASFQATFSIPNVWIKLSLFDNDVEIASARGKACATIYSGFLALSEDAAAIKGPEKKDEKKTKEAPGPVVPAPVLPKHKYIIQASIEHSEISKISIVPNSTDARPNSRGKPTSGSAKKKKPTSGAGASVPSQPMDTDLSWHLRIISMDTTNLVVIKDTEKEDRFKMIKESWEATNPGRAVRARELRDTYVKLVESGNVKPAIVELKDQGLTFKPWTILKHGSPVIQLVSEKVEKPKEVEVNEPLLPTLVSFKPVLMNIPGRDMTVPPHVLQTSEIEFVQTTRKSTISEMESIMTKIRKYRIEEKDRRSHQKKVYVDLTETRIHELDNFVKVDSGRRDLYRARVIKEQEEYQAKVRAAQDAMQKAAAELVTEPVIEETNLVKKKVGGKK